MFTAIVHNIYTNFESPEMLLELERLCDTFKNGVLI